ncbi:MAG TPA: hypothetical protein VNS63_01910, partial [Blastocatellia bacterium]|nr:hypothetical protein [Blastocatellia bacterium]
DQTGRLTFELFQAFREWGVSLENVSGVRAPENASEIGLAFDLLNGKASFKAGLGAATLLVTNVGWNDENQVTDIARAGIDTLQKAAGVHIEKQFLTLAIHVSSHARSLLDLTAPFIKLDAFPRAIESARAYGFGVYRDDGYWIVDRSALYTNALFVRINREFEPDVSFEQLAEALRSEELGVLDLLGLRIN